MMTKNTFKVFGFRKASNMVMRIGIFRVMLWKDLMAIEYKGWQK